MAIIDFVILFGYLLVITLFGLWMSRKIALAQFFLQVPRRSIRFCAELVYRWNAYFAGLGDLADKLEVTKVTRVN